MQDNRINVRHTHYVISFDAETDGLHGDEFAFAAVILDRITGDQIASFVARLEDLSVVKDPWVREHIVPLCQGITRTYPNRVALRTALWNCWMMFRKKAIPVADCGTAVEAPLFRRCIEDNPEERSWLGPFPLHDVGTLLLMAGYDPQQYRDGESAQRSMLVGRPDLYLHHPYDDALASGLCFVKFHNLIEELRKGRQLQL